MEPLNPNRTKVIACATVIEEMLPWMPDEMAYEVLDFGLHLSPGGLKGQLQQAIDAAGDTYDTILLGYGLCSLAVIGLKARHARLAMPRIDDCIALFLGSGRAYREESKKEPGTYYLTKGWLEVADTPFDEYERLVIQYGEARAGHIMEIMLKHYTRLVYIDTGKGNKRPYLEYARKTAGRFNLRFEEIRGSNALILKLLAGPWDADILVVPPGGTVNYLDFKEK